MTAAATDKFQKVSIATATTLDSPGYTIGGTSVTVVSTTNWPTDTGITFAIDTIDANGDRVAGSYNEYVGTVASATSITNVSHVNGTDQDYSAGTTTRVYIPVSEERENRLVEGMLVSHNQDGTLKTNAVTTTAITDSNVTTAKLADGAVTNAKLDSTLASGWVASSASVSSVTANGNRSYTIVTGTDISSVVSPGMRLRTTRTVAAPTQVASLNGTNNYFSKTSPAGMTFTDDFTCMAWVKLESYGSQYGVISRRTGTTNGFTFSIGASGQVQIFCYKASTYDGYESYQSIPLGKWVHIAASLDLSGNAGEIYINGILVPDQAIAGSGALNDFTQSGDLNIGAIAAANYFDGKIAQAAVFSAVLSASTIRSYISQGLSGSETSLISAYSFNNSITDLNTTNANNLTNNNSTSITNADSPFGGQAGGTISSTLDYAIVQAISGTSITVQVPEGCTIPTSGGVSALAYSIQKSPYGFPGEKGKWQLRSIVKTVNSQASAVLNTWYNLGSSRLDVPVGDWMVGYSAYALIVATNGNNAVSTTLSTSSSSESDGELSVTIVINAGTSIGGCANPSPKSYSQTTQNPLYLNTATLATAGSATIYNYSTQQNTVIYADNAYL